MSLFFNSKITCTIAFLRTANIFFNCCSDNTGKDIDSVDWIQSISDIGGICTQGTESILRNNIQRQETLVCWVEIGRYLKLKMDVWEIARCMCIAIYYMFDFNNFFSSQVILILFYGM